MINDNFIPQTVTVALAERSYDIVIWPGLLQRTGQYFTDLEFLPKTFIITDETVASYHLSTLQESLDKHGVAHHSIVLPPGEQTKNFATLENIINEILDNKPERGATLVALGGGVIGDITGFAASVILRGVQFIQIPTTLLAMVDSSVGGKTGINTSHGKNLVGTFYQPRLVLADPALLKTLPKRQFLAGYAEVVKYGLIARPEMFEALDSIAEMIAAGKLLEAQNLNLIIKGSCDAKASIVTQDEQEAGCRALLNLGHTFGHALEVETGYSDILLHGEAVAIGMVMAFDFSVQLGLCPKEDAERVRKHFDHIGLKTSATQLKHKFTPEPLVNHMYGDKKVKDGKLVFILVKGIGKAFIAQDVQEKDLLKFLEHALKG